MNRTEKMLELYVDQWKCMEVGTWKIQSRLFGQNSLIHPVKVFELPLRKAHSIHWVKDQPGYFLYMFTIIIISPWGNNSPSSRRFKSTERIKEFSRSQTQPKRWLWILKRLMVQSQRHSPMLHCRWKILDLKRSLCPWGDSSKNLERS